MPAFTDHISDQSCGSGAVRSGSRVRAQWAAEGATGGCLVKERYPYDEIKLWRKASK